MVSSIQKIRSWFSGGRNEAKRSVKRVKSPKRTFMNLETLEDRCVPAQNLFWTGAIAGTDKALGAPGNWAIGSTGGTTNAATITNDDTLNITTTADTIVVNATSGFGSVPCAKLNSTSGFTGSIWISGGCAVSIWGSRTTGSSSFAGGRIMGAGTGTSTLNLVGGTLDYTAAELNSFSGSTTKNLELAICGGGTVNFTTNNTKLGATLLVGDNTNFSGESTTGTVNCNVHSGLITYTALGTSTVSANSTFNVVDNTTVGDLALSSVGTVFLDDGSHTKPTIGAGLNIAGGVLRTSDGYAYIEVGAVTITDASLILGVTADNYDTRLFIDNNLTFAGNSWLQADVNTGNQVQADLVTVGGDVTIGGTTEFRAYSSAGAPAAGVHTHVILKATGTMSSSFPSYAWLESGREWDPKFRTYLGKQEFYLTKLKGVVSGQLFKDNVTADNLQTSGEGFGSVSYIFTLYDAATNTVVDTVSGTSSSSGTYSFDVWEETNYYVKVQIYTFFGTGCTQNVGSNETVDNDFTTWSGISLLTGYTSNMFVNLGDTTTWTDVDAGWR